MRKVLIIAYYFPPLGWSGVQRTLKFVKYLRDFGWEPIVVTVGKTKFSILDETLLDEIPKEIEVIRIDDVVLKDLTELMKKEIYKFNEASLELISDNKLIKLYEAEIEKKFSELRDLVLVPDGNSIWANNVVREIENRIDFNHIDIIYTTSGPYSAHVVGNYIKKLYGIRWISDFRDQWINNPYINYDKNSLRYKIEKDMEKSIVLNCDRLITTTSISRKNYINMYELSEEKVVTITNGYDENDFKKLNITQENKSNKFKIVYNGSFYLKINPYTFAIAVKQLLDEKKIDKNKIEIILNGESDSKIVDKFIAIMSEYSQLIINNGYMNHEASLIKSMNANLLLVISGEGEGSKEVYTGKIFEYLRLKKPILALSPKESLIEELLSETECGINVEYNNVKQIKQIILHYYDKWLLNDEEDVKANNIEKYERRVLTRNLVDVFNDTE
ncbi:glycosyltransferase [Clostridium butyricum]|uniref:glycosyltransferase n=1 Tax=Clostridium butyricum TaxID=1492 RepID=UPI00374E4555